MNIRIDLDWVTIAYVAVGLYVVLSYFIGAATLRRVKDDDPSLPCAIAGFAWVCSPLWAIFVILGRIALGKDRFRK